MLSSVFSILELRQLLRIRDAQMDQLQNSLNDAIKSTDNLSKSLAQVTKSNERLVEGLPSRHDSFSALSGNQNVSPVPARSAPNFSFGPSPETASPRGLKPSFATTATAAKDLPLRVLETERQNRLRSMQPLSPAARRQRQVRNATSASEYGQCYVKLASKRISVVKKDLEFIGVRVDLVHNIAFPTA
ncbi:unnamed protein product [Tilletia laevis]|uniref:Uncharacterized protein n=3 Tax=Tilletia TaxID=13289 RepID=A0A9N8M0N1_9BASI|nr:hypothetical protein CF336_g7236 [Tilletia laevis]KAE8193003.1 hypothetical protein CF335_g5701 [Tilletia laevis]KAE8250182.1 hypothetical protein A4X03_0g6503 [Tilletia caries]CAD6949869.1 unnamed protein product [Tilletia laevis]CAD6976020.1 unnamed protein product [Tilletia controversa]